MVYEAPDFLPWAFWASEFPGFELCTALHILILGYYWVTDQWKHTFTVNSVIARKEVAVVLVNLLI